MNQNLVIRRLWWKELRQLLPLVALLLGAAACLHLIFLMQSGEAPKLGQLGVFVGLPGFFAVGAGVLLIGQEKEQGTIGWISALPTVPQDIIRTKLLACLVGLVVTWLASLTMVGLATRGAFFSFDSSISSIVSGLGAVLTLPLHSLYLLLAGVALAWRFQSSFIALLVLVPLAVLPALTGGLLNVFFFGGYSLADADSSVLIGCQLFFCVAVFWWGWRNGLSALGPVRAAKCAPKRVLASKPAVELGAPALPFSALLWQAARQNKSILIGCTACIAVAIAMPTLLAPFVPYTRSPAYWLGTYSIFLLIPTSWLGVSTFQGDSIRDRIRFLADRGVSPSVTWVSRHVLPLLITVLSCFVVVCVVAAQAADYRRLVSCMFVLAFFPTVYLTSQWAGQVFKSPIVSAIAGPALSCAAIVYLRFAQETLGAPIWILVLCAVLPLPATFLSMRRWMDGAYGWRFWAGHGIGLAAFLLVPVIPLLVVFATTESMSPQVAKEIEAVADGSVRSPLARRTLVLRPESATTPSDEQQNEVAVVPLRDSAVIAEHSLRQQLAQVPGPITLGAGVHRFLRFELARTRLRLNGEPTNREELIAHYQSMCELTTTIVQRLRAGSFLSDQDAADQLEINLLTEILWANQQDWSDAGSIQGAIRLLADRAARNQARRRALAHSWREFVDPNSQTRQRSNKLGGYPIPTYSSNFRYLIERHRSVGRFTETLWQFLDAPSAESAELRTKLAKLWPCSPARYGLGPNGQYQRADDLSQYVLAPITSQSSTVRSLTADNGYTNWHKPIPPGTQWHADWERQAEQLAESPQPQPLSPKRGEGS